MLKILVVDDEESIRHSLSLHLTQLGHSVDTITHPLECACVQNDSCRVDAPFVDVIIADQCMPNMTGLDFIAGRAERGCKGENQHLAIMSGYLSDDDIFRALELGCRVFNKPFILEEIEQWLDAVVKQQ